LARGSILDVAVNIRRGSPDYGPAGPYCEDDDGQSALNLQQ
jgi:dTDP-4-dehydrorhamnose 3,5-epimerase-like enzyme